MPEEPKPLKKTRDEEIAAAIFGCPDIIARAIRDGCGLSVKQGRAKYSDSVIQEALEVARLLEDKVYADKVESGADPLVMYLIKNGYFEYDAVEFAKAYRESGIEAAVDLFAWADDDEHDYTGELRDCLQKFEKSSK